MSRFIKVKRDLAGNVLCKCKDQAPARRLEVKNGKPENKGRYFYACAKNQADIRKCKAFYWDDEIILPTPTESAEYAAYRLANPQSSSSDSDSDLPPKKRTPKKKVTRKRRASDIKTDEEEDFNFEGSSEVTDSEVEELESKSRDRRKWKGFKHNVIDNGTSHLDYMNQNEEEDYILPNNSYKRIPNTRKTRSSSSSSSVKNVGTNDSHLITPISPINKKIKLEYPITPTPSQSQSSQSQSQYQAIPGPSYSQSQSKEDDFITFGDEIKPIISGSNYQEVHSDVVESIRSESNKKDAEILAGKRREEMFKDEIEQLEREMDVKQRRISMLEKQLAAYQQ